MSSTPPYQQAPGRLPQRLTPQRKSSILSSIKNMLPFTIYNAIATILSPCCNESTVPVISVACVSTNIYNISIALQEYYNPNLSPIDITIGNTDLEVTPDVTHLVNGIATFENVDITGIGGADTYSVQVTISVYSSGNTSVNVTLDPIQVVFPAC